MSKRRNKNKKAGPVKVIRPAEVPATAPAAAAIEPAVTEDAIASQAAAVSTAQAGDAGDAPAVESIATAAADTVTTADVVDEAPVATAASPGEELSAPAAGEATDAAPVVAVEEAEISSPAEVLVAPPDGDEVTAAPAVSDVSPVASGNGKRDRTLHLGKRGKRGRDRRSEAPEEPVVVNAAPLRGGDDPLPEAAVVEGVESSEPSLLVESGFDGSQSPALESVVEAEMVADAPSAAEIDVSEETVSEPMAAVEEAAPAVVEVVRVGPSEPRIAAFAKLTEYQTSSLAHVAGLPEEADVPGHWRGVGFGIGGRRFVAGFDEVVEVIRMPVLTHVPGTQPWMLGVANVRGTLLPVVDLKQFLEGERTVVYEGQRVMVVRQSGGNVAVLIDQLFGQRTFNDSLKVATDAQSEGRYGHFIKQIYRASGSDWAVFSMAMLTRTPEFRQAAA